LKINSLQEPGRGQVTSEYDFEPLLKAVLRLDKDGGNVDSSSSTSPISGNDAKNTPLTKLTGGGMTEMSEVPLTQLSDEEYKEQEDKKQKDINPSNIRRANSL